MRWVYRCGPNFYDIKVGYACNNRCIHCAVGSVQRRLKSSGGPSDLSTEQVNALVDGAAARGATGVVLTGGEVTIRGDCEVLVRHAASRGLRIILHTNGRAFSDRGLVERLAGLAGISYVIALHASRSRTHDRISGRDGSFRETCQGVRNLCNSGRTVVAKLVLLEQNRGELVRTMALARCLGVAEFCVAFPYWMAGQRASVRRYAEVATELQKGCTYAAARAWPVSFETVPYCIVPDLPQMWSQNCDLVRADWAPARGGRQSTADWDELRPAMKVKRASCHICVFDRICEGPWREYVAAYGFGEFVPVRPEHASRVMKLADGQAPGSGCAQPAVL